MSRARYLKPGFLFGKLRERGVRTCLELLVYRSIVGLAYRLGVRHLRFNYSTIGHLAVEPDLYLKDGILGLRPRHFGVALMPSDTRVGNEHLLSYWQPHLRIIRSPRLCRMLRPFLCNGILEFDIDQYAATLGNAPDALFSTARYPELQRAWGDRPALLTLTDQDRKRGRAALRALGIPDDAWYVCVHCREPGFHQQWDTHGIQKRFQDYRNAEIESFYPAMQQIVDRGGWCIRMGDESMKPMAPMERVIDYAHSPHKSEWLDIFLSASCKFFLGTASGLACVPPLFGIPAACTNHCPMSVLPIGPHDLCIPKLVRRISDQSPLTFEEVLGTRLGNLVNSEQYAEAGTEIVDNTAEEIAELGLELLERVNGTAEYTPEDEWRQAAFKGLMRPGHYSYGGTPRIGREFLRRHSHLLPPAEVGAERQVAAHA